MFDYNASIQKADSLSTQAFQLRTEANKMEYLLSIVGKDYAGKDAGAYSKAVKKQQRQLLALADRLDVVSGQIKKLAAILLERDRLSAELDRALSKNKGDMR